MIFKCLLIVKNVERRSLRFPHLQATALTRANLVILILRESVVQRAVRRSLNSLP